MWNFISRLFRSSTHYPQSTDVRSRQAQLRGNPRTPKAGKALRPEPLKVEKCTAKVGMKLAEAEVSDLSLPLSGPKSPRGMPGPSTRVPFNIGTVHANNSQTWNSSSSPSNPSTSPPGSTRAASTGTISSIDESLQSTSSLKTTTDVGSSSIISSPRTTAMDSTFSSPATSFSAISSTDEPAPGATHSDTTISHTTALSSTPMLSSGPTTDDHTIAGTLTSNPLATGPPTSTSPATPNVPAAASPSSTYKEKLDPACEQPRALDGDKGSKSRAPSGDSSFRKSPPQPTRAKAPQGVKMYLQNKSELEKRELMIDFALIIAERHRNKRVCGNLGLHHFTVDTSDGKAQILDFAFSGKALDAARDNGYMAPEVLNGKNKTIESSSDVYSFAIIALEIITFAGKSEILQQVRSKGKRSASSKDSLGPQKDPWWSILSPCLSEKPKARPTMLDLYSQLKSTPLNQQA